MPCVLTPEYLACGLLAHIFDDSIFEMIGFQKDPFPWLRPMIVRTKGLSFGNFARLSLTASLVHLPTLMSRLALSYALQIVDSPPICM